MNVNTETGTRPSSPPGDPAGPSRADRARQLLRLAASTTPLPDGDLWSSNPTFGDQRPQVRDQIREGLAFVGARGGRRVSAEQRPTAAPFAWLNSLGSYRGAFYQDVRRDGPRRLDETDGPMSRGWRAPTYRPVREHLTRPGHRVGNHLAALAQIGVDAGIGVAVVARLIGWVLIAQFERAGMVAHLHAPQLAALASALGMCVLSAAIVL